MAAQSIVPVATYRLQLTLEFDFADAAQLTPYLASLGVSHVYLSPVFEAVPGSQHGYDVTDPTRFREELGGEAGYMKLVEASLGEGLSIILDIVPNHMSASHHNPWWYDVMRLGEESEFAKFFDISWGGHPERKLVLPALGDDPERLARSGELKVVSSDGGPELAYYDARFPVSPASRDLASDMIASASPSAGDLLRLLGMQRYSLEFWREGIRRINYRRFFDISGLVGVRVEDDEVFARTHSLIVREVREGRASGLRVDHVDGLRYPGAYLRSLDAAINPPGSDRPKVPVYIEKILATSEEVPADWPVTGTTGYEFTNAVTGVFVDEDGLEKLRRKSSEVTGDFRLYVELEHEAKLDVVEQLFEPELRRLAAMLSGLTAAIGETVSQESCAAAIKAVTTHMSSYRTYRGQVRRDRDARESLKDTFAEASADISENPAAQTALAAMMDLSLGGSPAGETPEAEEFRARWRQFSGAVMAKGAEDTAFYRSAPLSSLCEVGGDPSGTNSSIEAFHDFNSARSNGLLRSMNTTSTHDTKRSEDARARINALSELADDWNAAVADWMRLSSALATESNGVRSPSRQAEWFLYQSALGIWPLDPSGEALDDIAERLDGYMLKAAREAKLETSWLDPNAEYEEGLSRFIRGLVSGADGESFRESFTPLAERAAFHGAVNSLAQVTLKCAAPGFPDLYRGAETWDFSLVDPDNRRPVDFDALSERLTRLTSEAERSSDVPDFVGSLFERWQTGEVKQWITYRLMQARRSHRELFADGDYSPLSATGPRASNCCAFTRTAGSVTAVTAVTRLSSEIGSSPSRIGGTPAWEGTELPIENGVDSEWTEWLTGARIVAVDGSLRLSDVFDKLPVALLISSGGSD